MGFSFLPTYSQYPHPPRPPATTTAEDNDLGTDVNIIPGDKGVRLIGGEAVLLFVNRRRADALVLGVCMLGAFGLSQLLKTSFHRPRPPLPWLVGTSGYSFPSGHGAFATLKPWEWSNPKLHSYNSSASGERLSGWHYCSIECNLV